MEVKVVTYNILAAKLATPSQFPHNRPEDLDADKRIKKILDKLEEQVKQGAAVICLQEVSLKWVDRLTAFFQSHKYHFVHVSYGSKSDGYKGVAIGYPQSFETLDTKIVPVYDGKQKGGRSRWRSMLGLLRLKRNRSTARKDPWKLASKKNRRLIFFSLRNAGHTFSVGTYHMPVLFGSYERRAALAIQTAYSLKLMEALDQPLVFCGDFNFQPSSSSYRLVTKGVLDDDIPPSTGGTLPNTSPLRSAYAVTGGEPKFTNYAMGANNSLFAATLDYIFVSPEWTVTRTEELMDPAKQERIGPNPSEGEPSDHYLIGAWLELKKSASDH